MGANHTRGDTAIWVEADRVLFAGDVAMKAQPAFASPYSNLGHWLASLDRLEAFKPALIVPSHGPNGDNADFILGYRGYLIEVRDRTVAEKRAGKSVDQTVEAVTAASGWASRCGCQAPGALVTSRSSDKPISIRRPGGNMV